MNETELSKLIQIRASQQGARLWRNNIGAVHTADGRFIRFGLANSSQVMNKKIKSADLIGIKPVIITADMVGKTIGQFFSVEVKKSGWKFNKNDSREAAQLAWKNLIVALGGDARILSEIDEL